MFVVINAGGGGTRLWPLSKKTTPKQFCSILGQKTLIQETYRRAMLLTSPEKIFISIQKANFDLAWEQLSQINPNLSRQNLFVEEQKKDTLFANTNSLLEIYKRFGHSQVIIVSSDHYIPKKDYPNFFRMMGLLQKSLEEDSLSESKTDIFLCGIKPYYPSVNFGYLKINQKLYSYQNPNQLVNKGLSEGLDENLDQNLLQNLDNNSNADSNQIKTKNKDSSSQKDVEKREVLTSSEFEAEDYSNKVYKVCQFREKPNLETAKRYLNTGKYLWNMGYYGITTNKFFEALQKFEPEIFEIVEQVKESQLLTLQNFLTSFPNQAFESILVEKMSNIQTVVADLYWDDLGIWNMVHKHLPEAKSI